MLGIRAFNRRPSGPGQDGNTTCILDSSYSNQNEIRLPQPDPSAIYLKKTIKRCSHHNANLARDGPGVKLPLELLRGFDDQVEVHLLAVTVPVPDGELSEQRTAAGHHLLLRPGGEGFVTRPSVSLDVDIQAIDARGGVRSVQKFDDEGSPVALEDIESNTVDDLGLDEAFSRLIVW